MFHCRVIVFKEIQVDNQTMFQWFRAGIEEEEWLMPDQLFTEQEHLEQLFSD